jgi:hypothetical protein
MEDCGFMGTTFSMYSEDCRALTAEWVRRIRERT